MHLNRLTLPVDSRHRVTFLVNRYRATIFIDKQRRLNRIPLSIK